MSDNKPKISVVFVKSNEEARKLIKDLETLGCLKVKPRQPEKGRVAFAVSIAGYHPTKPAPIIMYRNTTQTHEAAAASSSRFTDVKTAKALYDYGCRIVKGSTK